MQIDVRCDECGEYLTATKVESVGSGADIVVFPCDTCMKAAYERGRNEEQEQDYGE